MSIHTLVKWWLPTTKWSFKVRYTLINENKGRVYVWKRIRQRSRREGHTLWAGRPKIANAIQRGRQHETGSRAHAFSIPACLVSNPTEMENLHSIRILWGMGRIVCYDCCSQYNSTSWHYHVYARQIDLGKKRHKTSFSGTEVTPSNAHGLLFNLHSGITPGRLRGPYGVLQIKSEPGGVQGKCPTCSTVNPAHAIHLLWQSQ